MNLADNSIPFFKMFYQFCDNVIIANCLYYDNHVVKI